MKQIKQLRYTKDNGEVSVRDVMVLGEPTKLYKCIDLSGLTTEQVEELKESFYEIDKFRDEMLSELTFSLQWKNFKTEGVEWLKTYG
jgi:hypothetical protein